MSDEDDEPGAAPDTYSDSADSGPFCEHWGELGYCDEPCARPTCAHPCKSHPFGSDCNVEGCDCGKLLTETP